MTLEPKPNGFLTRLRYGKDAAGKEQRDRFLIVVPRDAEDVALDRERRMQKVAAALSKLQNPQAQEFLVEMGRVAADEKAFRALEGVVTKLVAEAGSVPPAGPASGPSTFRDVAELWCSGQLAKDYPDHKLLPEKSKEARDEDRSILSVFLPLLGYKPVATITLADIDAARRLIPKGAHPNTRRKYALKLRMVLRLAESPLRLIARAPAVDIPRRKASNLFGFLYPQEEAQLLAQTKIPLLYRMIYGYLARNGCRIGETLQLTWDHVDLETGDIHIDKRWTKTQRARRWVLDTDVLEALEAWHRVSGSPKPGALVFPGRAGKRLTHGAVRKRFTTDLKLAGVTRKSILVGGDGIDPLRVHDLRASFVTLSLRAGRDLKWIMTRTGHETLGVLQVYDRLVQDANEHHLPRWFAPMAQAIPELRPRRQGGPSLGQTPETSAFMGPFLRPQGTDEPRETGAKHREKAPSVTPKTPLPATSGPAGFQGVGQPGPGQAEVLPDTTEAALVRIEESLAEDLRTLIAAGRYELADKVMAELRERRLQRTAPAITNLADARAKKGEGK